MSTVSVKDTNPIVEDEPKVEKLTGCQAVLNGIWPVRYRKRATAGSGELYIKTTIRNLLLYIIFLVILCIIVYGMVGLINFHFSNGMLSLFVDQELENGKTFRNGFVTYDDVWNYMTGPLLDGLHFETWYDLSNTTEENIGFIYYQNKILGRPRLLQIRVKDNSCPLSNRVKQMVESCVGEFSGKTESKKPFGKALQNINQNDSTYNAWIYSKDPQGSGGYSGLTSSYPPDGFMINLGLYKSESLAILEDLKKNEWLDKFTRAIIIDFTVYNGNVNLFNQLRLVIEFPPTGGMFNSWTVRTSKLLRYVSTFDYVVAACECLFVLFIIYYTIEEMLDLRINKLKYFKDVYNVMDLFILGLSYTTIGFSIYRTIQVNNLLDQLLTNSAEFQNFDTLTFCQELFNQASAVVIFFAWIKIFKYISLNKTLDQLNSTLRKSAKDIMYFLIIFFIIFFAYAALGYMLFSEFLSDYQNFFKTLFTLFRIILGDFDFKTLRANSPILGPIYFISFVFLGFFILLNMFMAIINQSYTEVKEEMAEQQPEFMLSDYLKLNYSRVVEKLNLRRDRILDIQEVLKSEEVCSKDELDFNLWRKELKKKGYADMEIESLFSRYDKDSDKKLNEIEKIKLVKDIAKARNNIRDEYQNFKQNRDSKTKKDAFEVGDDCVEEDDESEPRLMTRDDFDYVVGRIDRMELSVASIISKIDRLFQHLENMEIEKMRKRQEIARMLKEQTNSPDMDQNINQMISN
ncbi:polycystic kidney disease 2-like 1 [Brachionus plicatilis]|uniref:Polycystic kidney disease 2-like 1 n=1 Tax=Brachionus plicatilis TaxID=10195 RepID=A0A3M7QCZ5_BRAPC|nr:polycystic kidney disease 2-like 1 [Brachionus plicatilis]